MVLNGTRYIVNARPAGGDSSFGVEEGCRGDSTVPISATKERNRRLLREHRKSHTNLKKSKKFRRAEKNLKSEKELQGIRREGDTAEIIKRPSEGSGDTLVNNLGSNVDTEGERQQRILLAIEKRAEVSRRAYRVRKHTCHGEHKTVRPRVKITVGRWGRSLWLRVNGVRSCSASRHRDIISSAFRFALYRSNQRFKPGD